MAQVFHQPIEKFPVLHISFHMGEHYNSVRRGDDDMIKGFAPIKEYPIGSDLTKVKKMLSGRKDLDLNKGCAGDEYQTADNGGFEDEPLPEIVEYAIEKAKGRYDDPVVMTKVIKEIFNGQKSKMKRVNEADIDKKLKLLRSRYEDLELAAFDKLTLEDKAYEEVKEEEDLS